MVRHSTSPRQFTINPRELARSSNPTCAKRLRAPVHPQRHLLKAVVLLLLNAELTSL